MAGGCTDCLGPCKVALLTYALYNREALTSGPPFTAFTGQPPTESLYNFSTLSPEALTLAASLDASDALCQSSPNEWGSAMNVVTGTPQEVMDVLTTLNLSIPLQTKRELELGIERAEDCVTTWSIMALPRLFLFPTDVNSSDFGEIPAVAINVAPDLTECRPDVPADSTFVASKLAFSTDGRDLLAVVPEALTLFPYSFKSSMNPVSRVVSAIETAYQVDSVLEPLLHAYFGGCRVHEVNTTGIYVEDTCEAIEHWEAYGLMVQSPDDMPLCSKGGVCIHNYYNSQWEWVSEIAAAKPKRVAMYMNTFRSRYADTVGISVLPGFVVMQIFIMGIVSLYEVMSHKRSVLFTQIWAYRCQNGKTQVVYLAQVAYHLIYNSDLYLIGFSTGTLTTESLANLTCCFYAFSYSFINLAKSRSGDQQLDRHFRLTWEATQVVITACVVTVLRVVQRNPLESIISTNAEILRKTSTLGEFT
ncbi:uncharacterized protein KRP23_10360 [Phytophthora ramorum]|uniref:uncharacterized protein n=1 Tax=Phytophthora ramorum TaxID=164328 RepID=UPI0030A75A89|nr:hypothetical protein KRP23_10360 [Phytophthora ramorum]